MQVPHILGEFRREKKKELMYNIRRDIKERSIFL